MCLLSESVNVAHTEVFDLFGNVVLLCELNSLLCTTLEERLEKWQETPELGDVMLKWVSIECFITSIDLSVSLSV